MQHAYREDFDYYEGRADGLLASAQDGTVGALAAFERHGAPLTRDGAQVVIAREHGCESWKALRRHVRSLRDEPFAQAFRAVETRDASALRALLEQHGDLAGARGTNDNNLLGMASAVGDERLVSMLIEHGADVGAANAHGWTALHQAAYSNAVSLAQLLLDAGARVDVSARGAGGTPLVIALFWGHDAVASLLAERGVSPVNLRTAAGLGLELAGVEGAPRGFYRPHSGFPAWQPSDDPQEALDEAVAWAARNDRVAAFDALVARGAVLDRDVYSGTPLVWTAACGRAAAARALLERGVDPDQRSRFGGPDHGRGVTALHIAAQHGALDVIRVLLDAGADRTLKDELHGGVPADWAEFGRQRGAVELLRA